MLEFKIIVWFVGNLNDMSNYVFSAQTIMGTIRGETSIVLPSHTVEPFFIQCQRTIFWQIIYNLKYLRLKLNKFPLPVPIYSQRISPHYGFELVTSGNNVQDIN